jgi:hypothetical protein
MRSFDFGSSLGFGELLELELKSGAGLSRGLPFVSNYNRLESDLISAHFEPADLSLWMHRPAWPAKRSA